MSYKKLFLAFFVLIVVLTLQKGVYATNTSILAVSFNVSDFSFASSNYVTVVIGLFNTSEPQSELTLMIAANVEKTTGGGTNEINTRILVDDISVKEQELSKVQGSNDIVMAGFQPFEFNVSAGCSIR
jgi:hypothetical protein